MVNKIIRLQSIEITNFRNIEHGILEFNSYKKKYYFDNKSELLGLFGQNGSGKSSVVEALKMLKIMMSGHKFQGNFFNYLSEACLFKYTFYIESKFKYIIEYSFSAKEKESIIEVISEKLTVKNLTIDNQRIKTIIAYDENINKSKIKPDSRYNDLININRDNKTNIIVCKTLCKKEKRSFIFHDDVIQMFNNEYYIDFFNIFNILKEYSIDSLFVIESNLMLSKKTMFLSPYDKKGNSTNVYLNLNDKVSLNNQEYILLSNTIKKINVVLTSIVPDLTLSITECGKEINKYGECLNNIEIYSTRNNISIPFRYESDGNSKIILLLSYLITAFNNYTACIVIDDIDANLFEFLIGELLLMQKKCGKGQIIFTSHNLRPLEILNPENIVVTTTNTKNRFIKISNIKKTNNLRNVYLRSIELGGLEEQVYEETNYYEILHAFRKDSKLLVE